MQSPNAGVSGGAPPGEENRPRRRHRVGWKAFCRPPSYNEKEKPKEWAFAAPFPPISVSGGAATRNFPPRLLPRQKSSFLCKSTFRSSPQSTQTVNLKAHWGGYELLPPPPLLHSNETIRSQRGRRPEAGGRSRRSRHEERATTVCVTDSPAFQMIFAKPCAKGGGWDQHRRCLPIHRRNGSLRSAPPSLLER